MPDFFLGFKQNTFDYNYTGTKRTHKNVNTSKLYMYRFQHKLPTSECRPEADF